MRKAASGLPSCFYLHNAAGVSLSSQDISKQSAQQAQVCVDCTYNRQPQRQWHGDTQTQPYSCTADMASYSVTKLQLLMMYG